MENEQVKTEENADSGQKKKKHVLLKVLLIVAGVLILLFAAAVATYFHYYNKMNYVGNEDVTVDSSLAESLGEETENPEEIERLQKQMQESLDAERESESETEETKEAGDGVPEGSAVTGSSVVFPETSAKVFHIMLVGVDRTSNWNGNSDAMILCSVNYTKKTVTLTSFMRDSAAQIPGVGFTKLNHSFAVGNGPLLLETIRLNYAIPVDYYAWIDFEAMKTIIDRLGGVDVPLTTKEAWFVNDEVHVAVSENRIPAGSIPDIEISETQIVHLNGFQALYHARDRSSGGNDYQRTQRQRNVLMALVNKAKAGTFGDLVGLANDLLPYITHNVDAGTMASLLLDIPSVVKFEFNEQRIPYDKMYNGTPNGNLVPLYQETVNRWCAFVYGN